MSREQINFKDIPDKLFIPAVKVRDIVKARPLSIKEKKSKSMHGAPDIVIEPFIGIPYMITKEQLVTNFVYTSGKIIKASGWEHTKKYVVYRKDNSEVLVMKVPLESSIIIGGKVANNKTRKSGDYIVCLQNPDGSINRDSACIVPSALFKKMCYIPINDVISKYRGKMSPNFSIKKLIDSRESRSINNYNKVNISNTMNSDMSGLMNDNARFKPNTSRIRNVQKDQPARTVQNLNQNYNNYNQTAKYEVICQLHNEYGQRVGFVIKANNGDTRKITKDIAIKLAGERKLKNVELVSDGVRELYLRGNGIRLDDLDIEYI